MNRPASPFATRAAYGARQLSRIAWYLGHALAMNRLARRASGSERPRPHTDRPIPGRNRVVADMTALLQRDLENVEAGIYPVPADHDGSWATVLERSRLFFSDLSAVRRRRDLGLTSEVLTEETRAKRPRYYLQNFHFQSGGWMTDESAQRYDTQVEVLFNGTANATRRQALPELAEIFAGRDQRRLKLMDIGCGTGRFLDFVKQAWPRLPVVGLDLSEPYLREAERHLKRWSRIDLVVANAESIPAAAESLDAVTSIYLFHELPPEVRRTVLREISRILKPGGRLVIVDSLQYGDEPAYDGLLDLFPQSLHEPYYTTYIAEDFGAVASDCGLVHRHDANAFLAKVMVFDKRM